MNRDLSCDGGGNGLVSSRLRLALGAIWDVKAAIVGHGKVKSAAFRVPGWW